MGNDMRVMLVEEANRRTDLRKMLNGAASGVTAESGFGTEAVTVAQEFCPDVIVLGLEEPIARPLRTIEILTMAMPSVGIVAVSSSKDVDMMRKAMRAGARDYLARPAGPDELHRTIQAVYEAAQKKQSLSEPERQQALHRGDVLVVFGAKGGVGKTTLAVNLAAAIAAETKQRVALVDFDSQMGDVALLMGVMPEHSIADAAASADRLEPEFLESLLYPDNSGVRVLPSPPMPEESAEINAVHVGKILDALARTFDYVVVDTAPVLDDVNAAVLERATMTLLVSTPELPSLKRTKIALGLLLKQWEFPEERVKLVMNYPYSRNGAASSDIEGTLDYPIFWKVPNDTAVLDSLRVGRPCVEAREHARYSRSVVELARSVCGIERPARGLLSLVWQR